MHYFYGICAQPRDTQRDFKTEAEDTNDDWQLFQARLTQLNNFCKFELKHGIFPTQLAMYPEIAFDPPSLKLV